jgi:hypothetical protein
MALTKEQFLELRRKGLSVDQIAGFERGEKPRMSKGLFTVDMPQEDRQAKIQSYQQEANQAAEEATKANSASGFVKNFGKAFVGNIATAQVGLGNTIGKIFNANSSTTKGLEEADQRREDMKVQLLKTIREKEQRGEDATRLKQAYNREISDPSAKAVKNQLSETYKLPTLAQATGQIAGTALDVLTAGTYSKAARALPTGKLGSVPLNAAKTTATAAGLPELGTLATQQARGMFSRQGATNILKGTGVGYASDVAMGLQGLRGEEREGAKAFIPGAGTLIGGGLTSLSEGAQTARNVGTQKGREATTATKRLNVIDELEKRYSKVADALSVADAKKVDARDVLSRTNLLNGAVDKDGLISSQQALSNFDEFIKPYEGEVRSALEKEGRKLSINEIARAADEFVRGSKLTGAAKQRLTKEILADLRGFQLDGNRVPLTAVHDTKVFRGSSNNYLDTGANIINKEATRFFKELVEQNANSIDVQKYNTGLSKLYSVRDVIEALDKTRIKGGRLGKYFASAIGAGVGGQFAGPLGVILGAETGATLQGVQMNRALGGDLNTPISAPSELVEGLIPKAQGKSAVPVVTLPRATSNISDINLQSSMSGSRNIAQTARATNPNPNSIPLKVTEALPKSTKAIPTPLSRVHPEDVKWLEDNIIFSKKVNNATFKRAQELLESLGQKPPPSKEGLIQFIRDAFEADFDRSIRMP